MEYKVNYDSPLGRMLLAADEEGLTGVWFEGQKYYARGLEQNQEEHENKPLLADAKRWLDLYFSGKEPEFNLPLNPKGTEFQREVWEILRTIPYGKTMTYGEIATQIAEKRGIARMSAQAVGGAVGHNPIAIFIPCHRVVGADGSLTGYAAGVERKAVLLRLEKGIRP